jgi:hypothetical protein
MNAFVFFEFSVGMEKESISFQREFAENLG